MKMIDKDGLLEALIALGKLAILGLILRRFNKRCKKLTRKLTELKARKSLRIRSLQEIKKS